MTFTTETRRGSFCGESESERASLGVVIRSRDSGRWVSLDYEFEARGLIRVYIPSVRAYDRSQWSAWNLSLIEI